MKTSVMYSIRSLVIGLGLSTFLVSGAVGQVCTTCHSDIVTAWQGSYHANTQADVADELATEWAGLPPDSVINGSTAEDCVACHAPLAVNTNGGMTEVEVMNMFFTTTGGVYTASTVADSANLWPHDSCRTCHDVSSLHPLTSPRLKLFNSATAQYDSVANPSALCGQCHGSLRFADTDHRLFDAWQVSTHGHRTQTDVAEELAGEWAGVPPDSVINGSGAENCIACHSPTATGLVNSGMTEVQALNKFFTTTGGVFTAATTAQDTADWPYVSCLACHDAHNPDTVSYFNSTTHSYEVMSSSDSLCGQCHGNLRFPDTDHMSYNIGLGTGGVGVADSIMMPGVKCVDCHMANDGVDGSASVLNEGHGWGVFIPKTGTGGYASCSNVGCHTFSADSSRALVASWQTQYAQKLATAQSLVADADSILQGSTDSTLLDFLAEAKANLLLAESDESGGAHNADYVQMLLDDAINKANPIITDVGDDGEDVALPESYSLSQNYPNPFNPTTSIQFYLPQAAPVRLEVFNLLGQRVRLLVERHMSPGEQVVSWDGTNDAGTHVASGVYFYRLTANEFSATREMILLK